MVLKRLTKAVGVGVLALILWHGFSGYMEVDIIIEGPSNSSSIVRMSLKQARRLESFFREVMISDTLAYTLAGVKPLSFMCYRPLGSSLRSFTPANLTIARGWPIWQQIQQQLPTERIQLWEEESPWVEGVRCLILADGVQCDQCIEQNGDDFRTILGVLPTPLLQEIEHKPLLCAILQKHDALLGILLGFGKHNAWLYYQNTCHPLLSARLPRTWHAITEKESSHLAIKRCTLQTLDIADLMLPVFVGDPHSEESQLLQKKYLVAREKLIHYYHGKSFLSATLSLYRYGPSLLDDLRLFDCSTKKNMVISRENSCCYLKNR